MTKDTRATLATSTIGSRSWTVRAGGIVAAVVGAVVGAAVIYLGADAAGVVLVLSYVLLLVVGASAGTRLSLFLIHTWVAAALIIPFRRA